MQQLLNTNLYVGAIDDISNLNDKEWAIVHATQTIHYRLFGWDRKLNKPDKNHPHYIYYEEANRLSLNWVDGKAFLYKWSGNETFIKILDFIDKWITQRKVLIHCDQGFSRSPSLCLLYFSKRKHNISDKSFLDAKAEFLKIYPNYSPGGIGDYIRDNWNDIH